MWCDTDWILDCFDALQAAGMNYMAVFGVPYIQLPLAVAQDLKQLARRQVHLKAEADAAAKKGRGRS